MSRTIGKYEILGPLGSGGMAEVSLACVRGAAGFRKLVVIKRLLPELAGSPTQVEMFLAEARTLASLQHANIVQVLDLGTDDGVYMVLELLNGRDLRAITKRLETCPDSRSLSAAMTIARGLITAMQHAHDRRVIHRDVTPRNIVVTVDGDVKLLDFGISKSPERRDVTRTGTIQGTLGYMSPEQCRGSKVDARSDVFSAAAVIYELTTGRRAFAGDSDYEVLRATIEQDLEPPSRLIDDYPPDLEAILMRALARAPEERYQQAGAMLADLVAFMRARRLEMSPLELGAWLRRLHGVDLAEWQRGVDEAIQMGTTHQLTTVHAEPDANTASNTPTSAPIRQASAPPGRGAGVATTTQVPRGRSLPWIVALVSTVTAAAIAIIAISAVTTTRSDARSAAPGPKIELPAAPGNSVRPTTGHAIRPVPQSTPTTTAPDAGLATTKAATEPELAKNVPVHPDRRATLAVRKRPVVAAPATKLGAAVVDAKLESADRGQKPPIDAPKPPIDAPKPPIEPKVVMPAVPTRGSELP